MQVSYFSSNLMLENEDVCYVVMRSKFGRCAHEYYIEYLGNVYSTQRPGDDDMHWCMNYTNKINLVKNRSAVPSFVHKLHVK